MPVTVYCQPTETEDAFVLPMHTKFTWRRWTLAYAWRCHGRIVHCHTTDMSWAPALLMLRFLGKQIVITIHAETLPGSYERCGIGVRFAARRLLHSSGVVWIAVNETIRTEILRLGARPQAVHTIPAYLPSPEQDAGEELPEDALAFLAASSPKLVTYAFKHRSQHGTGDDYGLDICVRSLPLLLPQFPSLGLLISVSLPGDGSYVDALKRLAAELGVLDRIHFITGGTQSGDTLWRSTDLYIRATRTDGDSLAVREALERGTRVVASDAAARLAGVVTFRSGDAGDLGASIAAALARGPADEPEGSAPQRDFFSELLAVYRSSARP